MLRIVTTESGKVRGLPAADPRITSFKGIPFAAPPVGNLRWRAPQPVAAWDGVLDCLEFAPISMQHIPGLDPDNIYTREWNVDPEIKMDEDCLYLNVWTPAKTTDEKLPVFVWYFGGGLQEGNPAEMEFDGERLARRGIVVVSVNYRLNVFGFLAHPQLTKEQPDAPSNFGHLDQQAGTRWVKRNIAAFGGDPDNITIGGQSAGGMSVSAQLTSPQNEGLFQRAIIQSGMMANLYGGDLFPARTFADAEQAGAAFFEVLGVKTLEEARALKAEVIRDKSNEARNFFGTTNDGVFQIGEAQSNLLKGKRYPVPLMVTHTESEFKTSLNAQSMAEFKKRAEGIFGEDTDAFLAFCGDSPEEAVEKSTFRVNELAARALAQRNEELGISHLFYAVFDAEIPGWDNPGTFHSVDLWFFFETLAKCWRPFVGKHYDLARQMCNYWANFIKNGDPNGKDADGTEMPVWEPYSAETPKAMWWRDQPTPVIDKPDALMKLLIQSYLRQNPV
jgi:para-nitrobenzyl esterase